MHSCARNWKFLGLIFPCLCKGFLRNFTWLLNSAWLNDLWYVFVSIKTRKIDDTAWHLQSRPSILLNTNLICLGTVKECQHSYSRKIYWRGWKNYKGWLRKRECAWDKLWTVHKERSQVVTKKVQRWVKYKGVTV